MANRYTVHTGGSYYLKMLRRDPCALCGTTEGRSTHDHIFPSCRGGDRFWMNMTGMCARCNSAKGHMSLLDTLLGHKQGVFRSGSTLKRNKGNWCLPVKWFDPLGVKRS